MTQQFAVLLAAAGKSQRFAGMTDNDANMPAAKTPALKKPFAELCGQPVWQHSAAQFAADPRVRQILVILAPDDLAFFESSYSRQTAQWSLELVAGGTERFESVENGLRRVRSDIDFVAIHDAARPCVTSEQIDAVFRAAEQFGAAILASPLVGTIKLATSHDGASSALLRDIAATVPREELWEAQTPQVFRRELIVGAFAAFRGAFAAFRGDFAAFRGAFARDRAACGPMRVTDDAQLVENIGHTVKIVPSDRTNLKITAASDLFLAEQFLQRFGGES